MSDIDILKELIKEEATVALQFSEYGRKIVVLEENEDVDYRVTINGMPEESQVIIIKADNFTAPKSIFSDLKHECKRADYIIIAKTEQKKVVIYIEMKAKSSTTKSYEVEQQLKGAKCFVAYCVEIVKEFWGEQDFLGKYNHRFVSIRINGNGKMPTRIRNGKHDRPESMLKITSPHRIEFNHLAG